MKVNVKVEDDCGECGALSVAGCHDILDVCSKGRFAAGKERKPQLVDVDENPSPLTSAARRAG